MHKFSQAASADPFCQFLRQARRVTAGVVGLSAMANLLALIGSLCILRVYDQVLPSPSLLALVGLTVLMVGLYAAFGVVGFLRGRVVIGLGIRLDRSLREPAFAATLFLPKVSGVIAQGETLMLIVPSFDALVIDAEIAPQDIDRARAGQPAFIRLAAFDQRTTPEFDAQVTRVAADLTREKKPGAAYFVARLSLTRHAGGGTGDAPGGRAPGRNRRGEGLFSGTWHGPPRCLSAPESEPRCHIPKATERSGSPGFYRAIEARSVGSPI